MPMLRYDKIIENKIRSENMTTLLLLRQKCAHHYGITLVKCIINYLVIDNIIFSKRCASQMQLHSTHAPLLPRISECKVNGIHLSGLVEEEACS